MFGNVAKVSPMPKAGGRWNTFVITAKAPTSSSNSTAKTVDVNDSNHAAGTIALQWGTLDKDVPGGGINWRTVTIRSL